MQVFQWNALRVGDHVRVHDDLATGFALHDGVVALVQTYPHRPNDVGIRVRDVSGAVAHPRRHAVHLDRGDTNDACWRCDASSAEVTS